MNPGTFSVLAIMTEKSVTRYATLQDNLIASSNSTGNTDETTTIDYGYSPLQVAALLCFLVGVIQVCTCFITCVQVALKKNKISPTAFDVLITSRHCGLPLI